MGLLIVGTPFEVREAVALLEVVDSDAARASILVDDPANLSRFVGDPSSPHALVVARDPNVRRELVERISQLHIPFTRGIARGQSILPSSEIGFDTLVGPLCLISSRTKVGNHVLISPSCSIAHDCTIGDFATIEAGAVLAGYVIVESGATIGIRATIANGTEERPLRIGAGAFVAPGAVVTKSVRPGRSVAGNPAREIAS